ncbi:peptidase HslV family [Moorella phage MTATph1]
MGADSAGVGNYYNLSIRADRKVFKNGPFLMGFTSSFRMGQLLQYSFVPPDHPFNSDGAPMDTHKYMATVFIDAVRDCLKNGGFAAKYNEKEEGGTFLVGYRGRLFYVLDDYQVGEPVDNFFAVGCGASFALGSLYSTLNEPPEQRIYKALEAAEHFSAGVRRPFVILRSSD